MQPEIPQATDTPSKVVVISRKATPYLFDHEEAVDFLTSIRWEKGAYCPRCDSGEVFKIGAQRTNLYRCRACKYTFSPLAESYFHGLRISTHEQLQFVIVATLETGTSRTRLSRLTGWSDATIVRRLVDLPISTPPGFARAPSPRSIDAFQDVGEYFIKQRIELQTAAFRIYLQELLLPRNKHAIQSVRKPRRAWYPANIIRPTVPVIQERRANKSKAEWCQPTTLSYVVDAERAREKFQELRWGRRPRSCPRCCGANVLVVNSKTYSELLRCDDCKYMFNCFAGTIFQGSKLPANTIFQLFILRDALGEKLMPQDAAFALECSPKTAGRWLDREIPVNSDQRFAVANRTLAGTVNHAKKNPPTRFHAFCSSRSIVVDPNGLLSHIKAICLAGN